MKIKFPYQNLSLKNLPKEQWKDLRDFEGLYQVSNYGRVKSLERQRAGRWDKPVTLPTRILRQRLVVRRNRLLDEPLYTLIVSLSKESVKGWYSTGRLVYDTFVEHFDLADKKIFIGLRDKDGRNLNPDNLYKTNISELREKSFQEGRSATKLSELSKPVTQFDQNGIPIRSYRSMYEAGKLNGFIGRSISSAVTGKCYVYKGYFWRWGIHTKPLKIEKINAGRGKGNINTHLQRILNVKKIDPANPPAFLNLSLINMKGERWKDVPGYEGLYKISNLGRVKTLARVAETERKAWVPECIKHLTIDFRKDKEGNPKPGNTVVTLSARDGHKKLVSVARLVYYCFVAPFDLSDSMMRVYYKDGNTLNLQYKNLMLKRGIWSIHASKETH